MKHLEISYQFLVNAMLKLEMVKKISLTIQQKRYNVHQEPY